MAISIRGIRIKCVTLTPKPDSGECPVVGTYELISSADKVLAEQSLNSYGGMKIPPSPATVKAMDAFLDAYRNDINSVLGLETT